MKEQKFGSRRCRDTRKPLSNQCPDITFHRCAECGALFQITGGHIHEEKKEEIEIQCCKSKAIRLISANIEDISDNIKIDYQTTGGYNDNAVKVSWIAALPEYEPEWIYLKTFTGGYLKYIAKTKRSPMVFALADTDAFSYCDEDPCLECVFRCKRGFVIYFYSKKAGLIEVPLDRMTAQWQSEAF